MLSCEGYTGTNVITDEKHYSYVRAVSSYVTLKLLENSRSTLGKRIYEC